MDEERKKRGPEIQKKQKSDVEKKRNPKTLAKLKLGDNVLLYNGEKAVVKFIGSIHRKKGDFYGVELLDGLGKHDGSLNGKRYFKCPRNRGLFLRKDKIQKKIEPQPAPGRLNVEERRSHREKTKPLSKKADSPKPKRRRPSAVLNQKFTEQLVKGNSEKLEPTVKKKKVRKHNRSVSLLSQVNANAKRVKRNRTRSRNFSQTAVDLPGSNIMVGIRRKRKTPVNKEKLDEFFREAQLMQTREKQKAPDNKNQCPAIDLQIFQKYCAENGFNLGVNQFLLDLHSQSLDLEQGVNMSDFRAILSHYHNKSELEGRMMELFQVRGLWYWLFNTYDYVSTQFLHSVVCIKVLSAVYPVFKHSYITSNRRGFEPPGNEASPSFTSDRSNNSGDTRSGGRAQADSNAIKGNGLCKTTEDSPW